MNILYPDLFPETLLVVIRDGHTETDSLKVAERFEKRHKNVIQSIETEHDPDEPLGTERARAGADAVFAVARRKGATEKLVQRVSNAFSKGITPQGIGAVDTLMKVISEREVADALPELFNHGGVK